MGCCIMDNPIGDFFRDVGDFVSSIFCSDSGCSYHPRETKTASDAMEVANELADIKAKTRERTSMVEKGLMDFMDSGTNEIIDEIERHNVDDFDGKSLNINIKGIRQKNEALKKDVIGHFGDDIDKRLVQTDKELSLILKEKDDKKRKRNFDDFVKRVYDDAFANLKKQIEKTVNEQRETIEQEIKTRLEEVNKSMSTAENSYNEILAKKEKNEDMAAKQINIMYENELFSILGELAEEYR